ncbi:hypothetical protein JOM56_010045 [Amanita muscaria]
MHWMNAMGTMNVLLSRDRPLILSSAVRSAMKISPARYYLSLLQVQKRYPERQWCASDEEIESLVRASRRLFIIASRAVWYILDKSVVLDINGGRRYVRWFLLRRRFRAGGGVSLAQMEGGGGEKVPVTSANVKLSDVAHPPPSTGKSTRTSTSSRLYSDTEKKPLPLLWYSPLGAFSPSFEDVRLEGTTGMAVSVKEIVKVKTEDREDDTFVRHHRVAIRSATQRIDSEYTMSSGRTY